MFVPAADAARTRSVVGRVKGGAMRRFDEEDEAEDVQLKLQDEIEEAVIDAIARLRRVARGDEHFVSDHELRACVALARMTRFVIVKVAPAEPERQLAHPDHSQQEIERLLDVVEGKSEE
jgi:hypothetical protein